MIDSTYMSFGPGLIDETFHERLPGSSPPAKKVTAAFKIATSSRSLRFSASRYLITACSSLVIASQLPVPIPAWITQHRSDSVPTPS